WRRCASGSVWLRRSIASARSASWPTTATGRWCSRWSPTGLPIAAAVQLHRLGRALRGGRDARDRGGEAERRSARAHPGRARRAAAGAAGGRRLEAALDRERARVPAARAALSLPAPQSRLAQTAPRRAGPGRPPAALLPDAAAEDRRAALPRPGGAAPTRRPD